MAKKSGLNEKNPAYKAVFYISLYKKKLFSEKNPAKQASGLTGRRVK